MPLLIDALAFLLPLAAFLLWRRFRPGRAPSLGLLLAAAGLVVVVLALSLSYGLNHSIAPGGRYVPATAHP